MFHDADRRLSTVVGPGVRTKEISRALVYQVAILFWCQPYIESANTLSELLIEPQ